MSEILSTRPQGFPQDEQQGEGHVLPPPRCAVAPQVMPLGEIPLLDAAAMGDVSMLGELLESGAFINAQNRFGNTALHIAVREGHAEAVRFLRAQKDVDEGIRNNFDQTPRQYAADASVAKIFDEPVVKQGVRPAVDPGSDAEPLGQILMMNIFLIICGVSFPALLAPIIAHPMASVFFVKYYVGALGAVGLACGGLGLSHYVSTLTKDAERRTERKARIAREGRLMASVKKGDLEAVKNGLAEGLNPNGCGFGHPLLAAVKNGNATIVRELLAYGADPNVQDGEGYTPVFRALFARNRKVAKALLESPHTNLAIRNSEGKTAAEFMRLLEEEKAQEKPAGKEKFAPGKSARARCRRTNQPMPAPKPL